MLKKLKNFLNSRARRKAAEQMPRDKDGKFIKNTTASVVETLAPVAETPKPKKTVAPSATKAPAKKAPAKKKPAAAPKKK
jgi:hypothetical protein